MPTLATDLWGLTRGQPYIDAALIPRAIEEQVRSGDLDYRTRLLIRDSVDALRSFWGEARVCAWLEASSVRTEIAAICADEYDKVGFPSLGRRFVAPLEPGAILGFLRSLGTSLPRTVSLAVGGAVALILRGYLRRSTDDVNVVDDLPTEVREAQRCDELEQRHGLKLVPFLRQYLPMRWEQRAHTLGAFSNLQVTLVDGHDVLLSKLFSNRHKDLCDLNVLYPLLLKQTLKQGIRDDCQSTLAAPDLRQRAEQNWYILTGESLPT